MSTSESSKEDLYSALVSGRKACTLCDKHLQNASHIRGGEFDSDRIGAYTQWQGNLDSQLMVVAQDFSDVSGFLKCQGWPGHNIQTNTALIKLLECAGLRVSVPSQGNSEDRLFFTNAVLCMKSGASKGRQQSIPQSCFNNCNLFLKESIELVAPRVVVTLGVRALHATRRAFGISNNEPLARSVARPIALTPSIQLVPLYHPSPTVINTRRSMPDMVNDWKSLMALLALQA
jgi:uracil-DNA glycosylase